MDIRLILLFDWLQANIPSSPAMPCWFVATALYQPLLCVLRARRKGKKGNGQLSCSSLFTHHFRASRLAGTAFVGLCSFLPSISSECRPSQVLCSVLFAWCHCCTERLHRRNTASWLLLLIESCPHYGSASASEQWALHPLTSLFMNISCSPAILRSFSETQTS